MPRRSGLRVVHNPAWKKQSAFGTQIPNNQLTAVLQLVERNHIEVDETVDPILECSGQFQIGEEVLTKLGKLPLEVDADANTLGGLFSLAMGVTAAPSGGGPDYSHALSLLDGSSYQLPTTTFGVGFKGVANSFKLLKDAVLNRLRVSVRGRERARISAEFIGNGQRTTMTGFTSPECTDIIPIKLKDGLFTIDGVDVLSLCQEVEFEINNNILEDDAFTLASIDPVRLERDDLRTFQITAKIEGYVGDALSAKAQAKQVVPVELRFGTATRGLLIDAPNTQLKEERQPQGWNGRAGRSVLNLVLSPWKISGDATTPFTVTAFTGGDTQYLTAAA